MKRQVIYRKYRALASKKGGWSAPGKTTITLGIVRFRTGCSHKKLNIKP